MTDESAHAAHDIQALKGHEGIRLRPAMYIGDTGESGMRQVVSEIIANSIDQVLQSHATRVDVSVGPDGRTVSVTDDGAGMPFDVEHEEVQGESCASVYLTKFHYKPTADDHAPHIHLHSLYGCGVIVPNALSRTFHCASWRGDQRWAQAFERGVPLGPPTVIEKGKGRGTTTKFVLDAEIFGDATIAPGQLREFLREKASLFQAIDLRFNGESLAAPNGLADLARDLYPDAFCDDRVFHMNVTYDDMIIHAAAAGEQCEETHWRTWVNAGLLPKGGTHKNGFVRALQAVQWEPVVALIHVMMRDPKYTGSIRSALVMPEFEDSIAARIEQKLAEFLRG